MGQELDTDGLTRFAAVAGSHIGDDRVPGPVALVAHGDEVHVEALGTLAVGGRPVSARANRPPVQRRDDARRDMLACQQALELRDVSAFALVAEDFIQHAAGPQGREGFRQTLATLDQDLDHPTATIHRVVAQDDLVVVQFTVHGQHVDSTMPLLADLPPTGNAVAVSEC